MFWNTENFRYTPINAQNAQNEFRLLHLAPRYPSGWQYATSFLYPNKPISCVFEKVSLKRPPKYLALSYRWGGTGRQILVNGKPFTVTDNLEIALQHLRKDWEPLTLWVDAICINQQDTEEKTQQVQQMTDIYRRAKQVLIWLGPAADGSDQVMDNLRLISQVSQRQDLRKSMRDIRAASSLASNIGVINNAISNLEAAIATGDCSDVNAIKALENEFENVDSPFLDNFPFADYIKLCNREWWSRTWVIQELCVPELPVFVCGNKRVSYHDFSNCSSLLEDYRWKKFKRNYSKHNPDKESGATSTWISKSGPADTMMSFRHFYQHRRGKCNLYYLLRIMSEHTAINAQDPRDKIFSLLGFVSDKDKLNICINYAESYSPKDAYIDTSRALLEQGHLELLSLRQVNKSPDLPSWVCDWGAEAKSPFDNPLGINKKRFTASGLSSSTVEVYDTNTGRHIAAIRTKLVDAISSLASPATESSLDWDNSDPIRFFVAETRRIVGQLPDGDIAAILTGGFEFITPDKRSIKSPYRRRVTAESSEAFALLERWLPIKKEYEELTKLAATETVDKTERTFDEREREMDEMERRWSVLQPLMQGLRGLKTEAMTLFMEAVSENLERKAFCGQKGYKGLVPADAKEGDLLCVFLGSNLPSVVRKVEDGRFKLIGEAYIHGFMDGELMKVAGDQITLELC